MRVHAALEAKVGDLRISPLQRLWAIYQKVRSGNCIRKVRHSDIVIRPPLLPRTIEPERL